MSKYVMYYRSNPTCCLSGATKNPAEINQRGFLFSHMKKGKCLNNRILFLAGLAVTYSPVP